MFTFPENMAQFFQDVGQHLSLLSVLLPLFNFLSPLKHKEVQQYNKFTLLTEIGCWITPTLASFH